MSRTPFRGVVDTSVGGVGCHLVPSRPAHWYCSAGFPPVIVGQLCAFIYSLGCFTGPLGLIQLQPLIESPRPAFCSDAVVLLFRWGARKRAFYKYIKKILQNVTSGSGSTF